MSEWLVDWCLFLLTVAVRVLVGVLGIDEATEHRPKHALRDKTSNGAGVVRTGNFRFQGDDSAVPPQRFSVRVG